MGGIEIVKEQKNFSTPIAPLIVSEAAKRGLICRSVTFDGQDTLVFAPPLTISKTEIDQMIDILHDSILAF
ncbi:hypothetical protein GCM10020331_055900 [Ectobacillus funiculus]